MREQQEDAEHREALRRFRREYARAGLTAAEAAPDPFRQFERWFAEAVAAEVTEPNAMVVATTTPDGVPSARVVLLKAFDARGFVFYTNYESQKGRELAANPVAALVFYWAEVERQLRISGRVERVSREESARYFASRPFGSRLGALASRQSRVLPNRETLEERVALLTAEYHDGDIPLPDDWGGYRVIPTAFEFWQGRPNRLHDRLRYTGVADGTWTIERLSP